MKRIINDIRKYYTYIIYSVRATLKAEVAGSYLNWVWWVLEPFCFMIIYATVFGIIFESSELYFPIFIFIGNAMWGFFSKCMSASVSMIKQNETIISKVYLPKYVLLLVEVGVNAFKLLLNFGLVIVMLVIFRVPVSLNILYSALVFSILMIVTFAIACFLLHWGVYIEDLSYVISIVLNMLMFFSGVFYDVETRLDAPYGTIMANVNPIAFLMDAMRDCVMYNSTPNLAGLGIWLAVGLVLAYIGIRVLYKNENNYAKIV